MTNAPKPILCWVTDRAGLPTALGRDREAALVARISEAASAGIDWIQVREKDMGTPQLADLARKAVEASRGTCVQIMINDRLDLAWGAGAAGIHLGEGSSLPVAEVAAAAHRALGRSFLVGASSHSQEVAERAAKEGADYVFFGPIFATPSKAAFGEPQGLARLERVCHAVAVPVIAIGGITPENAAFCMRAGAAGIAAIRLFQQARDLAAVVGALRAR